MRLTARFDVAEYGRVLSSCAAWISDDPRQRSVSGNASRHVRARATATAFAMAPGLYSELQEVCTGVVAEFAAVPP